VVTYLWSQVLERIKLSRYAGLIKEKKTVMADKEPTVFVGDLKAAIEICPGSETGMAWYLPSRVRLAERSRYDDERS
jgi:hypothetical protein